MKYSQYIYNDSSKGLHKLGDSFLDIDPDDHGFVVSREQAEILAKTVGGYIQDINPNFWLLRVDAPDPKGTVIVINGGAHRVAVLDLEDLEYGLMYPTSQLVHWAKHNFNVALIMTNVEVQWGWHYVMYYEKNVKGKVIDSLLKKFYRKELVSNRYHKVMEWFWGIDDIVNALKNEKLPLHLDGHCAGSILASKYISISGNYDFETVILLSPIFNKFFEDPMTHYMDFLIYNTSIPVIVVNHAHDFSVGVSTELSEELVRRSRTKSIHRTLVGGKSIGCPNFTLSHHGFYGMVDVLVDNLAELINEYRTYR